MENKKIFSLIPKIMAEVGHISKDRTCNFGEKYKFRGIDDVYFALQPLLAKYGVFFAPEVVRDFREDRKTSSGKDMIYTFLLVRWTFYADDGSSFTAITPGEAMDTGDKSANKAMSAAVKNLCFPVFCVPSEGDNDTENNSPEVTARPGPERPEKAEQARDPKAPADTTEIKNMFGAFSAMGVTEEMIRDVFTGTLTYGNTAELRTVYERIKKGEKIASFFRTQAQIEVAATLKNKANPGPAVTPKAAAAPKGTVQPEPKDPNADLPLDFSNAPSRLP